MIQAPLKFQHSAEVDMWLDCGQHGRLDLARVTPNTVEARIPRDIPPCVAVLCVTVDGAALSTKVRLADGFSKDDHEALALPLDSVAPF